MLHGEQIKGEQTMWTRAVHYLQVGADVHLGLSRGNKDAERQQEKRFHISCDFHVSK